MLCLLNPNFSTSYGNSLRDNISLFEPFSKQTSQFVQSKSTLKFEIPYETKVKTKNNRFRAEKNIFEHYTQSFPRSIGVWYCL